MNFLNLLFSFIKSLFTTTPSSTPTPTKESVKSPTPIPPKPKPPKTWIEHAELAVKLGKPKPSKSRVVKRDCICTRKGLDRTPGFQHKFVPNKDKTKYEHQFRTCPRCKGQGYKMQKQEWRGANWVDVRG